MNLVKTLNTVIGEVPGKIPAGELVYEQSTIVTLAELNPLNVEVYLPTDQYLNIHQGMRAEIRPEEPIGGVYDGTVKVIDQVFDAASGTFGVRIELPNPEYRIPGGLRCQITFLGDGTP